ncbi:HlyD family efflux transporter periplasmic adaptor subunit [Lachnoanaerobaculum gingivalis]|uniref:Secretion protein HlyD n=1 Tax=Lachnoanaerobaculum gingivalis TaxID=2490855 RepID=A0A3P3QX57_9FIRM|nr:HlyD family efflux transporter periplasmic adaptor subunit [Lachnoanaerobaculum gingivalis]RRJ25816.1 secretion protein HlyD [Lachnoanaerobaculum gingivalis]WHE88386.1 HlyD family efflux transporter periplasmic adaptor subunit [Lachnoanaerobaculum gingivalis]
MADSKKIIPYRKKRTFNVGVIIFLSLLIYLIPSAVRGATRKQIRYNEVVEGSMSENKTHTGLILRDESVQVSPDGGYINIYMRDGKRAAVGSRVYSLDATGDLKKLMEASSGKEDTISDSSVIEMKKKLSNFTSNYSDSDFEYVYDTKYLLDNAASEYSNLINIENIDNISNENGLSLNVITSPYSGEISYAIDDIAEKKEEDLTKSDFDTSKHPISYIKNEQLIEAETKVYRIVKSESWSIYFEFEKGEEELYAEKKTLTVKFKSNGLTLTGDYSVVETKDGYSLGKLTFDKYMVQFISNRYAEFDIQSLVVNGLKIPSKCVLEKDFYTIPVEYMAKGGDGVSDGFYKQVDKDGTTSTVFVPEDIIKITDTNCYISTENKDIASGDKLIKPDSNEIFEVSNKEKLLGVYNINKGYTVFKNIDILGSNKEFYIVDKGTKYGLKVYDHILLNPDGFKEGEFIYQ